MWHQGAAIRQCIFDASHPLVLDRLGKIPKPGRLPPGLRTLHGFIFMPPGLSHRDIWEKTTFAQNGRIKMRPEEVLEEARAGARKVATVTVGSFLLNSVRTPASDLCTLLTNAIAQLRRAGGPQNVLDDLMKVWDGLHALSSLKAPEL